MRVLVVDDHRNTRETLALGLALHGFESDTAGCAADALTRLSERHYDWIVSDVRMPGTDGIALVRAARRYRERLGVILMTAYDVTPGERVLIGELGAALLIKPVTVDTVAACCTPREPAPDQPQVEETVHE